MNDRRINRTRVKPVSTSFNCSNCDATATSTCTRCSAVKYCSKTCQTEHWNTHKDRCKKIKDNRAELDAETAQFDSFLAFSGYSRNYADHPGNFWCMYETQPYCHQRVRLAHKLGICGRENNSKFAFELALEHVLDLVWLIRVDAFHLKFFALDLLLLHGRIQEAYDFMKWWVLHDPQDDGTYDWSGKPYMHLSGEDMFEGLESTLFSDGELTLKSVYRILVLKIKLEKVVVTEKERFGVFLLATDPRTGAHSQAIKLRNNYPVLSRIYFYAIPTQKADTKLKIVRDQLKYLTNKMDSMNELAIPALLNQKPVQYEDPIAKDDDPPLGSACEAQFLAEEVRQFQQENDQSVLERIKELFHEKYGAKKARRRVHNYYKIITDPTKTGLETSHNVNQTGA